MKKLHNAILDKRTRYDLYINIEIASQLEQLSEALNISKSEAAEQAISMFFNSKNTVLKAYLQKIETMKKELKNKTERSLNLFDEAL